MVKERGRSNDLLEMEPVLLAIEELREHEECDPAHLEELSKEILCDGILKRPIIADEATKVILDGHHRFNIIKRLGKRYIPVYLVDYMRPEIEVHAWDGKRSLSKENVLKAGISGQKLPPRTSRHMVRIDNELHHITYIEREKAYPLEKLV